jgi:phosphoribosylanthranilate isomerase
MFRIKICGVTNVTDAIAAVDAGADAIGLNFYEKSPRWISLSEAQRLVDEFYDHVIRHLNDGTKVEPVFYPTGVFVNHPTEFIRHVYLELPLVLAQIHGDESSEAIGELSDIPVIRVRRFDARGCTAIAEDLAACRIAASLPEMRDCRPCAVLVDAGRPGHYGGTGETLPWLDLADHKKWLGDTPLILAGGLTPDNVAEAIRIVRPHGVDVASGVESAPGKKDPHKVRDFIAAARAAFGE